jgi:hypothetical protein
VVDPWNKSAPLVSGLIRAFQTWPQK